MTKIVLYAMPGSLYSAKARSYLRKQRLEIEERVPGDPRFGEVVGKIGRWIIPVIETPDGDLVQDSRAIIDWVEAAGLARISAFPDDPVQRVIALIFELFGGEGLVRPAMHYRWNFDADNMPFIEHDFVNALAPPGVPPSALKAVFDNASGRMRKAAVSFGVTPATYALVEESYLDFLHRLDAHLARTPYLLGSEPTLGDYGLIGPLHAHLARDPHPSVVMKREALHVWRWVERMTTGDADAGEFMQPLAPAELVATLAPLLAFIAEDYLPELVAMTDYANAWLAEQDEDSLKAPCKRGIGMVRFVWRGQEISAGVMPYRLWLLQQVVDAIEALGAEDRALVLGLLEETGLGALAGLKTSRRVVRRDNAEWWE
jgi:glutathione S-transferase